jgi:hypothetical protein
MKSLKNSDTANYFLIKHNMKLNLPHAIYVL